MLNGLAYFNHIKIYVAFQYLLSMTLIRQCFQNISKLNIHNMMYGFEKPRIIFLIAICTYFGDTLLEWEIRFTAEIGLCGIS